MSDQTDMSAPSLKDTVSHRLLELGINAFEAARRGSLGREFVNDIIAGRKLTVRGTNLIKLATALETTPEYLLGIVNSPNIDVRKLDNANEIIIEGEIRRGYRHNIMISRKYSKNTNLISPKSSPNLSPSDQCEYLVSDESCEGFASIGDIIRCVRISSDYIIGKNHSIVVLETYERLTKETFAISLEDPIFISSKEINTLSMDRALLISKIVHKHPEIPDDCTPVAFGLFVYRPASVA